jgi:hypothetical protein
MEIDMGHFFKSVLGMATVGALAFSFAGFAEAGCKGRHCKQDRYGNDEGYGYVTAQATFGGRTVTAPIRPGRWGDEVLIPGGTWVDCEKTCEYTLRRLTVDFWDGVGKDGFVGPGYFRYDFDLDTGQAYRRGPALFGRY